MYTVGELAKMAGVSARTLRYYDQAGLLKPSAVTEAGYRMYGDEAVSELTEILFFRELDFSIDEILRVRSRPDYDAREALERQKTLLTMRRERLDRLIALAGRALKGEVIMELNAFDMTEIEEAKAKEEAKDIEEARAKEEAKAIEEARAKEEAKAIEEAKKKEEAKAKEETKPNPPPVVNKKNPKDNHGKK
jgi:DNA-binding transcriptional MerR regulator